MADFGLRLLEAFRIDLYLRRNIDFSVFSWTKLAAITPATWLLLFITLLGFVVPLVIVLPPLPLKFTEALVQTHTLLTIRTSRAGNAPTRSLSEVDKPTKKTYGTEVAKVERLCVYPVVPCRGIEIAKSKMNKRGMQYDGIYAFVHKPVDAKDDAPWEFLMPADCPKLGRLGVEIWVPDIIKTRGSLDKAPNETFIIVSFPWVDSGWKGMLAWFIAKVTKGLSGLPDKEALLPVEYPTEREIRGIGYQTLEIVMGGKKVKVLEMTRELPEEIKTYLEVKGTLGLVRLDKAEGDRGICMVGEKIDTAKDFVIRRPNITVTQTIPEKYNSARRVTFSQGTALFSSDWSYEIGRYPDGAMGLVPRPAANESESWLEVGMGIVLE